MGLDHSKQNSSEDDFDIDSIDEDSWKIVFEKLQKSPVFSKKLQSNKGKVRKKKKKSLVSYKKKKR